MNHVAATESDDTVTRVFPSAPIPTASANADAEVVADVGFTPSGTRGYALTEAVE